MALVYRATRALGFIVLAATLAFDAGPVCAQYQYDTLSVAPVVAKRVGVKLEVTAGPSGAPSGFSVWWMKRADFEAMGGRWNLSGGLPQLEAGFVGTPTLNTEGGVISSFKLDPLETVTVEIGDLFDETGVQTNSPTELEPGAEYVFSAFAHGDALVPQSELSTNYLASTDREDFCIHSQGYWKSHPGAWPVASLTLGSVSYTKTQLLSILGKPAYGNGLISLAHQLIAAKLNVANGASSAPVASTIAAADAQIGALVVPPIGSGFLDPSSTETKTSTLEAYNTDVTSANLCSGTPSRTATWGQIKSLYR
jgi:hypothetical protein